MNSDISAAPRLDTWPQVINFKRIIKALTALRKVTRPADLSLIRKTSVRRPGIRPASKHQNPNLPSTKASCAVTPRLNQQQNHRDRTRDPDQGRPTDRDPYQFYLLFPPVWLNPASNNHNDIIDPSSHCRISC